MVYLLCKNINIWHIFTLKDVKWTSAFTANDAHQKAAASRFRPLQLVKSNLNMILFILNAEK